MNGLNRARELFSEARARQEKGDLEGARHAYLEALSLAPERPSVLVNLAAVLIAERRFAEAEEYARRATAVEPGNEVAWMNLGLSLLGRNQTGRAIVCFDEALSIKPSYAEAHGNKGVALAAANRLEEALVCLDAAISSKTDYPEALFGRAELLRSMGRLEESAGAWKQLLSMFPHYRYAVGGRAYTAMLMCEWSRYRETAGEIVRNTFSGKPSTPAFYALAVEDDPEFQLSCAKQWANERYSYQQRTAEFGKAYDHRKIRVAYLSSDFNSHSVSYLSAGLFEVHDRERFEVYGISWSNDDSSRIRKRIEKGFDRFIDVRGRSAEQAVTLMRQNEIDIAVNLNGFTSGESNQIFASGSAPVQVNYLGFPGTMGAEFMDYVIGDAFVIPKDAQAYYAEKVVYLPDTFQVNDSKREVSDSKLGRKEAGLPESGFVFCSFVNSYKISPTVFSIWMRLLNAINGSVLWLAAWNPWVKENLKVEAARRGIGPERIVFLPTQHYADYLAMYRLADLSLDTLPFNGGTTSSDALWGGVPLVTCAGKSFAARMAGSLLTAVGLPELITYSLEEYEQLARSLASDSAKLRDIRARLAANRLTHPLFDTVRFARHLEAAYEEMRNRFKRGEAPQSFSVGPVQ